MSPDNEIHERSWRPHTLRASMLRVIAFLVPLLVSVLVGLAVGAALPSAGTTTGAVLWWVAVLVISTLALYGTDRFTRRLLPLATLLRLSMVFPDRAPSRVKMARRVTGSRAIQREFDRAHDAGAVGDRQQAAETILALVGALGDYDSRTRGHSERTQLFVTLLADQLKLKAEDKGRLMWAALVHDIGKLRVPHEVLNKPDKPSDDEWAILHSHPQQGALICEPLRSWLGEWWYAIEQHHEKYDGSGYPRGLAGAEISYGARIVSVADSYEVMTATRAYKRPLTAVAAREELTRCAGTQFDPDVVRAFLNISLGRMNRSAGPLSWILQLTTLRPSPILGQIIGGIAGVAAAAGAVIGLQLAPGTTDHRPADTVAAPGVTERPQPSPDPGKEDPPDKPGEVEPQEPGPPPGGVPPVTLPLPEASPTPSEPATDPEPTADPTSSAQPVLRDDTAAGKEDTVIVADVLANDGPGDAGPLSIAGVSRPSHGSVSQTQAGELRFVPDQDFHGKDAVTYRVRLADGSTLSAELQLTVRPVNDAPRPVDDDFLLAEDSVAVLLPVLDNDTDVDQESIGVTGVTGASHGAVQLAAGTLRYTPDPDYNGADSFDYTVSDGDGATGSATVDIVVMPGNDGPVAVDDAETVDEDSGATTLSLLGNDSDPEGDTLTVTSVTGAANGTVAESSPGVWTYTPSADYFGLDALSYVVSDGAGGTATAAVTVTVSAVPDAPVAVADTVSTPEDNPLALDVLLLGNDTDVDGDTLSVSSVTVTSATARGVVTGSSGSWSYTPDLDFNGTESLSYTIDDGNGGTDTATVTVTVTAVNDAPSAGPDAYSAILLDVIVDGPSVLLNDDDVDSPPSALTVTPGTVGAPPLDVTFNSDGTWSYTAQALGRHVVPYTVSDGQASSAGELVITVTAAPVTADSLFLQPGSTTALGSMGLTPAPAGASPTQPDDYDSDTDPGLTIRSGGDRIDGTDALKYQTWEYPVPVGGLALNGLVSMTLWTSLEAKTTQDLDYSSWLLDCPPAAVADTDCVVLASTDKIHVNDWNVTAAWEERTVNIGSVSTTVAASHTLRLRVGFNHADVWLAMDADHPSALNLTF